MRIKVVTGFSAWHLCGGAAIIRQVLGGLSEHEIQWLCISKPAQSVAFSAPHISIDSQYLSMRGNTRPWVNSLWWWYFRTSWCRRIASRISREYRSGKFDLLWIVYDGGLGPLVEQILRMSPALPLHVSLHDEPLATAQRGGHDPSFLDSIARATSLLREHPGVTVDSVTEGLIEQVFGPAKPGILVTMDVNPSQQRRFQIPPAQGTLRLGYSGNFYGWNEMEALVRGWDRWAEKRGRDWDMLAFGDAKLATLSSRIKANGPTAPEQVQKGLAACHCLLLPSPLDRPEMMTNLPTKLVSYTELGLPIVGVCPAGSETAKLLDLAKVGPFATSTDQHSIDSCLEKFDDWNWSEAEIGHKWLVEDRFSRSRILRELRSVLNSHLSSRAS